MNNAISDHLVFPVVLFEKKKQPGTSLNGQDYQFDLRSAMENDYNSDVESFREAEYPMLRGTSILGLYFS